MSTSNEELKLELIRFQTSYIKLIHNTSLEISRLKLIVKLASSTSTDKNEQQPDIININILNTEMDMTLFKSSEITANHQSYEEQIDDLCQAKMALIKSTSFEINRLRNMIKYINNNNKEIKELKTYTNNFENKPIEYSWNEIIKHNKKTDLWLVYNNKVFDISRFLMYHPGGTEVILDIAAKTQDITKIFAKLKHPPIADQIIIKHYIGNVRNKTAYHRMSQDLSKIMPIWDDSDNHYKTDKTEGDMNMDRVIGWTDLFSVSIAVLDKQHENLVNIINDIYNFYEIKDLIEFLKRWDIHCKTEETLFKYYNFDEKTASEHISDHKRIYHFIKDEVTFIRIKYNGEQPKCKELIDFSKKMVMQFKTHHFEFDTKYIDHLHEGILND